MAHYSITEKLFIKPNHGVDMEMFSILLSSYCWETKYTFSGIEQRPLVLWHKSTIRSLLRKREVSCSQKIWISWTKERRKMRIIMNFYCILTYSGELVMGLFISGKTDLFCNPTGWLEDILNRVWNKGIHTLWDRN